MPRTSSKSAAKGRNTASTKTATRRSCSTAKTKAKGKTKAKTTPRSQAKAKGNEGSKATGNNRRKGKRSARGLASSRSSSCSTASSELTSSASDIPDSLLADVTLPPPRLFGSGLRRPARPAHPALVLDESSSGASAVPERFSDSDLAPSEPQSSWEHPSEFEDSLDPNSESSWDGTAKSSKSRAVSRAKSRSKPTKTAAKKKTSTTGRSKKPPAKKTAKKPAKRLAKRTATKTKSKTKSKAKSATKGKKATSARKRKRGADSDQSSNESSVSANSPRPRKRKRRPRAPPKEVKLTEEEEQATEAARRGERKRLHQVARAHAMGMTSSDSTGALPLRYALPKKKSVSLLGVLVEAEVKPTPVPTMDDAEAGPAEAETKIKDEAKAEVGPAEAPMDVVPAAGKPVDDAEAETKTRDETKAEDDEDDEDEMLTVYIHDAIAGKLMPHQREGIQFMWDHVSTSTGFGCLLAHDMGLGKTLQVVSLIEAFLRAQIGKQALVLAPVTVIDNWEREFHKWLPAAACPTVRVMASSIPVAQRAEVLREWHTAGGVLICGFTMFCNLLSVVNPAKVKSAKAQAKAEIAHKKRVRRMEATYGEDALAIIRECLLSPGPDLVVADEAHIIRSSKTRVSQLLKQVATPRRIALTGYPFQNRLEEYWCMVDWVRPDYLSTIASFKSMFAVPITAGQCVDSLPSEIELSRARTHILAELLKTIVHRRTVALLHDRLNGIVEVSLTCQLAPLQVRLYQAFLAQHGVKGNGKLDRNMCLENEHIANSLLAHPAILKSEIMRHEEDPDFCRPLEFNTGLKKKRRRTGDDDDDVYNDFGSPPPGVPATHCYVPGDVGLPQIEGVELVEADAEAAADPVEAETATADDTAANNKAAGDEEDDKSNKGVDDEDGAEEISGSGSGESWDEDSLSSSVAAAFALFSESDDAPVCSSSDFEPEATMEVWRHDEYSWARPILNDYEGEQLASVAHSGKCMVLLWILIASRQVGDRVVVFSKRRSTLQYLAGMVRDAGFSHFLMDGSTPSGKRQAMIDEFNGGERDLFLMATRAGSLGINLIGANRVILFDVSWNPCHDDEAIVRPYRFGQPKTVYVYRLLTHTTVEDYIHRRQVFKKSISSGVVDDSPAARMLYTSEISTLFNADLFETQPEVSWTSLPESNRSDPILVGLMETNRRGIARLERLAGDPGLRTKPRYFEYWRPIICSLKEVLVVLEDEDVALDPERLEYHQQLFRRVLAQFAIESMGDYEQAPPSPPRPKRSARRQQMLEGPILSPAQQEVAEAFAPNANPTAMHYRKLAAVLRGEVMDCEAPPQQQQQQQEQQQQQQPAKPVIDISASPEVVDLEAENEPAPAEKPRTAGGFRKLGNGGSLLPDAPTGPLLSKASEKAALDKAAKRKTRAPAPISATPSPRVEGSAASGSNDKAAAVDEAAAMDVVQSSTPSAGPSRGDDFHRPTRAMLEAMAAQHVRDQLKAHEQLAAQQAGWNVMHPPMMPPMAFSGVPGLDFATAAVPFTHPMMPGFGMMPMGPVRMPYQYSAEDHMLGLQAMEQSAQRQREAMQAAMAAAQAKAQDESAVVASGLEQPGEQQDKSPQVVVLD
ncbi:uncharacterized protein AMSG_10901 [Thecamonas trahens ATCC 50062]|uniref:Uncharacterized protein n=1 Tax=Thecamonas trahens ATCC 50062 TaxID=461836 RepID=A0A0L0DSE5_THETB|nr:hypothetical protein AMSG_10901 [Thecamonas trahens ATCC 50062]KNC55264.1 hypothetical protein AMSG_10901 [Thecamonas trahens ATCC 50062]|eukprot:XP_013753087.1 hypothetical protein AMSG_10901 [Thecamonas trahens ATCC 50062]